MTRVVTLPWSFRRLGPTTSQPKAGPRPPAAIAQSRRLTWLRLVLARDEQTRLRPPITLGRLAAGEMVESTISASVPAPPPSPNSPPVTIAAVIAATARRFEVPVRSLIGYRCNGGPRPIALQAAMYLARTVAGATGKVVERELQTSPGSASYAVSRVRHLRTVDPELDQHIGAIEAELGAAGDVGRSSKAPAQQHAVSSELAR